MGHNAWVCGQLHLQNIDHWQVHVSGTVYKQPETLQLVKLGRIISISKKIDTSQSKESRVSAIRKISKKVSQCP